jgi:hypothetical protein
MWIPGRNKRSNSVEETVLRVIVAQIMKKVLAEIRYELSRTWGYIEENKRKNISLRYWFGSKIFENKKRFQEFNGQ